MQYSKSSTNILPNDQNALAALAGQTFLITGANGMLGSAFKKQLEKYVPSAVVYSLGKDVLDVRDPMSLAACDVLRPNFVLHCAGLVDADRCEVSPSEGRLSIIDGTRNVLEFSRRCNARILYPQSFLIYGDTEPIIDEQTLPSPLSVYGNLKLEAEQLILNHAKDSLSIRMAGFFGGNSIDNNFVGRIIPHISKLMQQGVTTIDIGNRVWQPTYTEDLAANCLLLLATQKSGLYCMASHGSASFYELTIEILRIIGIVDDINVRCVDAAILAAKEKARRPSSAIMLNRRLQREGLDRQRPWQISLAEYLNQPYFKDFFQ